MALLSAQKVVLAGSTITLGAASASDTVAPRKGGVLIYLNGSVSSVNHTRVVPGNDSYAQPRGDIVTAIAAGAYKAIPLDDGMADPDTGLVTVTLSSATTVSVAYIVA